MSPPLHLVRPFVFWLHYPNIFTWAFKILVVIGFSNNGDKAYEVLTGDDYLAVNTGNVKSCFFVLLLIFVVLFFIGLAVTHSVLKDKDGSAGSAATTPPPPAKLDPEIVVDDAEVGHEPSALLSPLLEDEGYSSRSSEDASEQVSEFEDVQPPPPCDPTDVELQKISYRYEAQPDEAKLEDISVLFKGSTVTALMGPSGAGKSTLLTLLTGRLPDGYVEGPSGAEHKLLQGRILVNGCDMESTQGFRNLGTLTPQDEHIPEVLTVREVLSYTAELRGVGGLGANNSAVESVLRELNLETVGDNVVGSAAKVGISGGQKKRVSVGIDLLANRPIMLVDEPTTGLDAASAANVLQALFRVSRHQNRTVVASIHQPAWELMQGFDQLVLLAKGRLMFTDAPSTLSDYFASGGAPVPEKVNPVDHVMFVLQADKSAVAKWHRFYEKKHMDTSDDPMVSKTNFSSSSLLDTGDHYSVSELKQFVILFRRMTRIFFVDDDQFMEFLVPGSINNLLTGLAFYNFPINFYTGTLVTTGLAGLSMFLLNGCVLTIPAERHVAVREFHNGTYSIRAFWFARCAVTIGMTTLFAPLFTAIWYSLAGFTGDFTVILHVVVSSLLSACSYTVAANIIGLIAGTQLRAAQICDPISLSAMLFSGTVIIRRFLKPFILPFYLISPINYAVENAMTILLEDKGDDGAEVLNYFEFHPDNRPRNYYILTFLLCATVIGGLFVANSTLAHL